MEQFDIFPLFSFSLTLPHTMGYLLIAGFLSIMITFIGTGASYMESPSVHSQFSRGSLVPSAYAVIHESLFRSILLMVNSYMSTIYFPLIYTIFHVILFSNLLGMIPYSSTPSVEMIMTLSMAFTLLMGVLI
jgi:F0F1-type ATP synthase membrane subunit a